MHRGRSSSEVGGLSIPTSSGMLNLDAERHSYDSSPREYRRSSSNRRNRAMSPSTSSTISMDDGDESPSSAFGRRTSRNSRSRTSSSLQAPSQSASGGSFTGLLSGIGRAASGWLWGGAPQTQTPPQTGHTKYDRRHTPPAQAQESTTWSPESASSSSPVLGRGSGDDEGPPALSLGEPALAASESKAEKGSLTNFKKTATGDTLYKLISVEDGYIYMMDHKDQV